MERRFEVQAALAAGAPGQIPATSPADGRSAADAELRAGAR
jgi:hypothetical protein